MTRINIVHPSELCDQHLIAEWRELTRIPNGIASGKYVIDLSIIPKEYTVRTSDNPKGGQGHMKFFFDKLKYLFCRYETIRDELEQRGMPRCSMWPVGFDFIPLGLWNDYIPTREAINLNRKRISERYPLKARYAKESLHPLSGMV